MDVGRIRMDLQLTGEIAIVTGGASGIGWACACQLAAEGCRVALWDISPEVQEQAISLQRNNPGQPTFASRLDITSPDSVNNAVHETEEALGPIAHVVHAAAIGSGKFGFPFTNLHPDDWRKVLEVNVMGTVQVAHAVAPLLRERRHGSITLIASVAAQIGSPTDPPYSASKAANINFAMCMAKDLAASNVRVNVINPGMVQTPLNRAVWQAWHDAQPPERQRSYEDWAGEKVRTVAPLGRWQTPEDIANAAAFLASPRAAQITGQCVNVDGGQVMHW
jgi:2-hydroxycyclohexanecarboxyl-CoA dehydrogenase